MRTDKGHRERGWNLVEVSLATTIGLLIVGGLVALTRTAVSVNESVCRSAHVQESSAVLQDEVRVDLMEAAGANVRIRRLANGDDRVVFDTVIAHFLGMPVYGVRFQRRGADIPVDDVVARADADADVRPVGAFMPWPQGAEIPGAKTCYATIPNGQGGKDLYRLWLTVLGNTQYADLVLPDVAHFRAAKPGNVLEVTVGIHTVDPKDRARGKAAKIVNRALSIVPRN